MEAITHFFVENLTNLIESYGLLTIFVLMTAESVLIPIPSEITMPFAGFMVGRGAMSFWAVVFTGAFANLTGSLLAYWLGFVKGEKWLRMAIRKWGKWLLMKESEFDKAKNWFHTKGQWVSFGSRMLPVVRTFISLPAGIAKMNLPLFSLLTFLGSFIWTAVLTYMGLKLGQNWQALEPYFRKFQYVIIGLSITVAVLYVWSHFKKKK